MLRHTFLVLLPVLLAKHAAAQAIASTAGIAPSAAPTKQGIQGKEPGLSAIETPEVLARVHQLMKDNVEPTLQYWRGLMKARNITNLTMENLLRTAHRILIRRHEATATVWAIRNNTLIRPHHDGERRTDAILMRKEHYPNKNAAEYNLLSLWLAIEEAMAAGVRFPDIVFLYNTGDQPMCKLMYPCDLQHAPPVSVMGFHEALLDSQVPIPPAEKKRVDGHRGYYPEGTGAGDFLISHFRFTGHSMGPSIAPHNPKVIARASKKPNWSESRQILRSPVPWESKVPKLFFRGSGWCAYVRRSHIGCPRRHLSNLTAHHPDKLNVLASGLMPGLEKEIKQHIGRQRSFYPLSEWAKFKYLAAIDGIAGSSRLLPLMHLGSVIVKQQRSPYIEWYYRSLKPGVHYEEMWLTDDDPLAVVDKLRADDAYARKLADTATQFARTYLVKEVMMVFAKHVLMAYKSLFVDMDEYVATLDSHGDSGQLFREQATSFKTDWRRVTLPNNTEARIIRMWP